jgi:hypothetical protein
MGAEGLRIAFVARSTHLPAWEADLLRSFREAADVKVVLFAAIGGTTPQRRWPWPARTVMRHLTKGKGFPHVRIQDVRQGLQGVTVADGPIAAVRTGLIASSPDLIIDLTARHAQELSTFAKRGVWWFRPHSAAGWEALPPGIVEWMLDARHARIDLMHTEAAGGERLLRSCTFTLPTSRTDQRLLDVYGHLARLPLTVLRSQGTAAPAAVVDEDDPTVRPSSPDPWQRFSAWVRSGFYRKAPAQATLEWNIGVLPQPISHLLEERPSLNVRWLPPPSLGSHRMEPFPYLDQEGELNVMYHKSTPHGPTTFSRVRPKSDNNLKRSRELVKLPHGCHYPFTFSAEGTTYVLVVHQEPPRTELYRMDMERDELVKHGTLLPTALHSPTLFPWQGKWWLMGSQHELENDTLLLYASNSLEGPWTGHPMNPVRLDARGARPAGTPFVHEGRLWRPGLDTTGDQGPRVVFHEVLRLDEEGFEERAHTSIGPFKGGQYPNGVRTISSFGDLTMVDGCRKVTSLDTSKAKERSRERRKARSRKS